MNNHLNKYFITLLLSAICVSCQTTDESAESDTQCVFAVTEIPKCIDGTMVFDYSTCAQNYKIIEGESHGVCWDESTFRLSEYENDAQCPSNPVTMRRYLEHERAKEACHARNHKPSPLDK